jgi:hypothetical protein
LNLVLIVNGGPSRYLGRHFIIYHFYEKMYLLGPRHVGGEGSKTCLFKGRANNFLVLGGGRGKAAC